MRIDKKKLRMIPTDNYGRNHFRLYINDCFIDNDFEEQGNED